MANSTTQDSSSDGIYILMGVFLVAIIGGGIYYRHHHGAINGALVYLAKGELLPFLALSRVQHAFDVMNSHNANDYSISDMKEILGMAGSYFRWILVPALLGMAWWMHSSVAWISKLNRTFDMKSLARHNVVVAACLSPIVRRDRFIIDEPPSTGPWRVAESPMLFAIRRGIIKRNGVVVKEAECFQNNGLPRPGKPIDGLMYDRQRAKEILVSRLGPPMLNNFLDIVGGIPFPRYMRGIIGACCAVALGDRRAGQDILDLMSRSFNEKEALSNRKNGIPHDFPINIGNADAWIIRGLKKRPPMDADTESIRANMLQEATEKHNAYLYVWMGAVLQASRDKGGTIPPQEFIWLRPCHRELWYFLNSVGGTGCHTEGAAPWSHWGAEKVLGRPIYTPYIDSGVNANEDAIIEEGWLGHAPHG